MESGGKLNAAQVYPIKVRDQISCQPYVPAPGGLLKLGPSPQCLLNVKHIKSPLRKLVFQSGQSLYKSEPVKCYLYLCSLIPLSLAQIFEHINVQAFLQALASRYGQT